MMGRKSWDSFKDALGAGQGVPRARVRGDEQEWGSSKSLCLATGLNRDSERPNLLGENEDQDYVEAGNSHRYGAYGMSRRAIPLTQLRTGFKVDGGRPIRCAFVLVCQKRLAAGPKTRGLCLLMLLE